MKDLVEGMSQQEIPLRRIVLRGALMVSCGLLAPAALFGCDKKETDSAGADPGSAATPVPAPDAASTESAVTAASKVTPASVQYQAEPKGDQKCSGCLHFIAESNTCKLVEGEISPDGWCILWVKNA